MRSLLFQDENIFYNNKEYQKKSKLKHRKNQVLNTIANNEVFNLKSFSKKYFKQNSVKNIKDININKNMHNNFSKNSSDYNIFENIKNRSTREILPLLGKHDKKDKILSLNNNSNLLNKDKDSNSKHLYLEYKIENNKDKTNNEASFIEIDPNQIISSLTEFPKIKRIFSNLTKKINQRNINLRKKNNLDSKINITDILDNLNKNKKNENINNINKGEEIFHNNKNDNFFSSRLFLLNKENIKNYSVQDLFLLDIVNKVIKRSIFFHDKKNQNINEDFMLKEYKNQIKKLNNFFHEKLNEKNINDRIGLVKYDNRNKNNSQKEINLREKLIYNEKMKEFNNNNEVLNKNNIGMPKIENKLINKFNDFSRRMQEKNSENSLNKKAEIKNLLKKPKLNLYNFDIGHKISIIDFDELLNKIHKKRVGNNNDKTIVNEDNFVKKLLNLDKKKIKFANHMIEEKTKLIKNKNDIFINKINKFHSRNIYNKKQNRKKLFIKNEILKYDFDRNTIVKEKNINELKKAENINKSLEETFSSINDKEFFLKSLNEKETKDNSRRKINIEKLGIKKDFGITRICFNKTIDKIKRMNDDKKIRAVKKPGYNYSFLNTIYGKINTKRKMKINEIDYKKELRQKGYQLLFNIFQHNPKFDLNKNTSAEDILMLNQDKEAKKFYKTVDKGTSTRES